MANLQLPPSVRDLRGQAIEAIANRMAQIDLSPLLVYRIDSVPAEALLFLGWQFDLLSPLWQLLAPANPLGVAGVAGAQQRTLIKNGIALHRVRGTPAALTRALAAAGFSSVTILEGQNSWGGSAYPSDQGWAVVRLMIALQSAPPDPSELPPWQPDVAYPIGALVSYLGMAFYANGFPVEGIPPIALDIDSGADLALITDWDTLLVEPWELATWTFSEPVGAAEAAMAAAVFDFVKPARAKLDSVWFVVPPIVDSAPVPRDILTIDGISESAIDSAPGPTDGLVTMAITMAPLTENYPAISPKQNAHYRQKGHNQGANQPLVADSVLTIDGVIHGESS